MCSSPRYNQNLQLKSAAVVASICFISDWENTKKQQNNVFFDLFPQFCVLFFSKWFLSCVHLWQIINQIFCSADGHYEVTLMTKATVYNTGLVVWQPPAVYKSSCSIDVEYFPYDVQTCVLKLGSWTYDGFKVPHLICNSNIYNNSLFCWYHSYSHERIFHAINKRGYERSKKTKLIVG